MNVTGICEVRASWMSECAVSGGAVDEASRNRASAGSYRPDSKIGPLGDGRARR
jgi:hypothetical protein